MTTTRKLSSKTGRRDHLDLNTLIQEDWDAHDSSCESLEEFWFGRAGHTTYGGSIYECYRCDTTFFRTGLIGYINDEGSHSYCECCFRFVRYNVLFEY